MSNRDQSDSTTVLGYVFMAIAYFFIPILCFRISPRFGVGMLFAGGISFTYWFYRVGRHELANKRAQRSANNTFAGRIQARLTECRQKEEQFRNESDFIRNRIQALREDLGRSATTDEHERARAQVLIKDFEAEFNLRHAKVSFFSDCVVRLEELLARHRLHQSIIERKRELEDLRKSNFDDEAIMEETRYHLEQDTIQLDTIAALSKDASVSFKAEQADELRERLDKLRSSLGGQPKEGLE